MSSCEYSSAPAKEAILDRAGRDRGRRAARWRRYLHVDAVETIRELELRRDDAGSGRRREGCGKHDSQARHRTDLRSTLISAGSAASAPSSEKPGRAATIQSESASKRGAWNHLPMSIQLSAPTRVNSSVGSDSAASDARKSAQSFDCVVGAGRIGRVAMRSVEQRGNEA